MIEANILFFLVSIAFCYFTKNIITNTKLRYFISAAIFLVLSIILTIIVYRGHATPPGAKTVDLEEMGKAYLKLEEAEKNRNKLKYIDHSAFLPDEIVMHNDFININLNMEGEPYILGGKSEYIIRYSDSIYFVKDKKSIFLGKIQFTYDNYVSDYKNVYVSDINYDGKFEFLITANVTNGMTDQIFYIVDSNGKNIGNSIVSKLVKKEFCSNYNENIVYFANPQFNRKYKTILITSKDGNISSHYLLNFEGNTYRLRQNGIPYRYGDIVINRVLKYKEENIHSTYVVYYGSDTHIVGHINDTIYIFSDIENQDKRKKIYPCDFSAIDILKNKNGEIWLKIKTKTETGWVKQSDQVVLFDPDGNK